MGLETDINLGTIIPVLDEVHELARSTAREFAERAVARVATRMDRDNAFPGEELAEAGKLRLISPMLPEELGGAGLDLRTAVVVLEELGRVSGGFSLLVEAVGTLFTHTLYKYGNSAHRDAVVPRVALGDAVGAFALSEPCCGSDAANIACSASREGGAWVIDGVKTWITGGLHADYFLVATRTGPREARHRAITVFLVKRGKCVRTSPIEVMGMRGSGTAEVRLEGCEVGEDDVVGSVDGGFDVITYALNVGRTAISGVALGVARGAYEEALEWARGREIYGRRLIDLQNTQFELADMLASIETGRALAYYSAYLYDSRRRDFVLYTHVAKLYTARMAVDVTRRAMQLEGGYGYSKESRVERLYRDAKLLEIGEGTNEVQKHVIYRIIERGIDGLHMEL